MNKYFKIILIPLLICLNFLSATTNNKVIADKNTRFTIITSQLIRIEWSEAGRFIDSPSFVFQKRYISDIKYRTLTSKDTLIISTEKLVVKYLVNKGKPDSSNLFISSRNQKTSFSWSPGKKDTNNLKGTVRTLDGWNGGSKDQLENGLISKDGWTLIDDSKSFLFDDSTHPWLIQRSDTNSVDWYFFGYGREYKQCLQDYVKIAGRIPIPPKFAFGNWWSKYWVYSDYDVRKLINEFRTFAIPLDVFIIDMDWHKTFGLSWKNPKKDPYGESVGWTGYTWNKSLFPSPELLLDFKENLNLKTALNLHPASGISPLEESYKSFKNAYKPDKTDQGYIAYKMSEKKFAQNYFTELLKPLENIGVDFWWLDWQQWKYSKYVKSLNNTWWLNHNFFTNMENSGKRPLLFHRWGGLGNHRYQIGFSGDVVISWQSLDFQPYFTSTASNVGYGYWSHDLGGHIPMGIKTDPELYLRWLQYGVFSPIFRTHSTKSKLIVRKIWNFPEYFDSMKKAVKLRYELAPYIYTSAKYTFDTGVSICKPLYYEFPYSNKAYEYKNEYFFGNDIIAAPITEKLQNNNKTVFKTVWLPEGDWFEYESGTFISGNKTITRKYSLDEIPYFINCKAIIPTFENVNNLSRDNNSYHLLAFPFANSEGHLYEDNQNDNNYKNGKYSLRQFNSLIDGKTLSLSISKCSGNYTDQTDSTNFMIKIPNSLIPQKVILNKKLILSDENISYDGYNLTSIINCGNIFKEDSLFVEIIFNRDVKNTALSLSSLKGKFKRLRSVITNLKYLAGGEYFIPDSIYFLEQTPTRINYNPSTAEEEIENFKNKFELLYKKILSLDLGNIDKVQNILSELNYSLTKSELLDKSQEKDRIKELSNRIKYKNKYSDKYPANGNVSLFDKKTGTNNYLDPEWQGFETENLEIIIDLKTVKKIKEIEISSLQNILYWIFPPKSIEIKYSVDNSNFELFGKSNITTNKNDTEIQINKYKFTKNVKARFLKIRAENMSKCPAWHHGAGGNAWLFVDEIFIK